MIIIPCATVVWFLVGPVLGVGSVIPDPSQAATASGSPGPGSGGGTYSRSTSIVHNDACLTGCETVLVGSLDTVKC